LNHSCLIVHRHFLMIIATNIICKSYVAEVYLSFRNYSKNEKTGFKFSLCSRGHKLRCRFTVISKWLGMLQVKKYWAYSAKQGVEWDLNTEIQTIVRTYINIFFVLKLFCYSHLKYIWAIYFYKYFSILLALISIPSLLLSSRQDLLSKL